MKLEDPSITIKFVCTGSRSIHNSITKNKLTPFSAPKPTESQKVQQIADVQDDVALSVERWRSRCVLQPYESAPSPILSDHGKLRTCKKSDLVECLDPTARVSDKVNPKTLTSKSLMVQYQFTFQNLIQWRRSRNMLRVFFVKFLQTKLQSLNRIDAVWDRYLASRIKAVNEDGS